MGKRDQFTDEQIEDALRKHDGVLLLTATELGVTPPAVTYRLRRNPELSALRARLHTDAMRKRPRRNPPKHLSILVQPNERNALRDVSRRIGQPTSVWMRRLVLAVARRLNDDDTLPGWVLDAMHPTPPESAAESAPVAARS